VFTRRINDHLELRLYAPHHADEVFAVSSANREHIRVWLPWIDAVKTVDDTREFIRKSLEQYSRDDGFQCGIWEDNLYIGGAGFHWINRTSNHTEIGYWLAKGAEGRGIMTAAVRVLIDYSFNVWKLNKVEIRAARSNHRSRAIPRRLGFTEEGVLRQIGRIGTTYHDLVVYGITAAEWSARGESDFSIAPIVSRTD
jgi:ribosomal-protein-serine acetyltransferase